MRNSQIAVAQERIDLLTQDAPSHRYCRAVSLDEYLTLLTMLKCSCILRKASLEVGTLLRSRPNAVDDPQFSHLFNITSTIDNGFPLRELQRRLVNPTQPADVPGQE